MLRVSEGGNPRRREGSAESYRQLGLSLLDLERAADRVFDRISQRTAMERDKLVEISQRIERAKARIDALSQSKKALIITSPLQHPGSHITEEDYCPLFPYNDDMANERRLDKGLVVNGGLNREFGPDGTLELFKFFSEENIGASSKEMNEKLQVGDEFIHMKEDAVLENLLKPTDFTCNSLLATERSTTDYVPDKGQKKGDLPPPPPSLLEKFSSTLKLK